MPYKLGAVGVGHWVKRLQRVMKDDGRIEMHGAVGVTPFEEKKDDLATYGITQDRYFKIQPFDPLPKEFFSIVDVVQIASHNQFHLAQTKQSLEHENITITEKTFATTEEGFNEAIDYIKSNGHQNRVTVHLHYLGKILTLELPRILETAIAEYGKVTDVVATFFEDFNPEDVRRSWLFKPDNGGILMDWIHPLEMLSKVCKADFKECLEGQKFIVNPEYDSINPTGVYAKYKIGGEPFVNDATLSVRVGKGFPHGIIRKTIRFNFEQGGFLDLNYVSAEQEFNSDLRGTWKLGRITNGNIEVKEWGSPRGPVSYQKLLEEMIGMLEGGKPSLSLDDIQKIYKPLWQFEQLTRNSQPKKDENEVKEFIKAGLEKTR